MIIQLALVILLSLSASTANAKKHERDYQREWCKGQTEYVLPDRSRVDCLTDTHAIEFDFARKWAESVGQALYYSFATGKQGGVVLILESPKDRRHLQKLYSVINENDLKISVWVIEGWNK